MHVNTLNDLHVNLSLHVFRGQTLAVIITSCSLLVYNPIIPLFQAYSEIGDTVALVDLPSSSLL